MLSDASRPVIEATLPVVGANIGEIAKRFYPHMFGAHPELVDGIFNRGNQARGEQQQSLAGSVATFASALVETPPRTPESLLRRIAHKHASLGINPGQYQVVHDNLMWAIRRSRLSGVRGGVSIRALANEATEPASDCCCSPRAWLPRLKMPSRSSGWAPNMCG